eukprot:198016-Pelagomonas_calceolata.AAC.3
MRSRNGWCSMTMGSRSKRGGGAHKPHELLAMLKKGSHPWDGKLYPVIRDERVVCAGIASTLSALTTLPTPNASPRTWQKLQP